MKSVKEELKVVHVNNFLNLSENVELGRTNLDFHEVLIQLEIFVDGHLPDSYSNTRAFKSDSKLSPT